MVGLLFKFIKKQNKTKQKLSMSINLFIRCSLNLKTWFPWHICMSNIAFSFIIFHHTKSLCHFFLPFFQYKSQSFVCSSAFHAWLYIETIWDIQRILRAGLGIMSLAQEVLNTSHIRLMLIMFEENTSGFCSYFQGNLDL